MTPYVKYIKSDTHHTKLVPIILCILTIMFMFLLSQFLKQAEIIFPEALALCIGAWYLDKMPWQVTRKKLIILMSLSSFAGVCIVRYLPDLLLLRISIGFILVILILTISKSTLYPIISACILPIMLHTTNFIYCFSVLSISCFIVLIQWILTLINDPNNVSYLDSMNPARQSWNSVQYYKCWCKRFLIYFLFAAFAIHFSSCYLITPPLIVLFTELTKMHAPIRKRPFAVILLFTLSAVIGMTFRVYLIPIIHWPSFICAGCATMLLLLSMYLLHLFVPPAGACLLLTFLLPGTLPVYYPLFVCAGTTFFVAASILFFRDKKHQESQNRSQSKSPINNID